MKRTLCIGDCHGHFDRLEALLHQEGIIRAGERINRDVEVIQLGDLGDYRRDSKTGDQLCWQAARDGWLDLVLFGNHDRAVFDRNHGFLGYDRPRSMTFALMYELQARERLVWAAARHGYLLTHAGLHPHWIELLRASTASAEDVARLLNDRAQPRVNDTIGMTRGGTSKAGGILWRDDSYEPLARRWLQVYGHTRGEVRVYGQSYCVDVGSKDNGRLAGVWLPEGRIVEVGVNVTELAA